jgi:hypothetical protein
MHHNEEMGEDGGEEDGGGVKKCVCIVGGDDENEGREKTFEIINEDHTLGNALRHVVIKLLVASICFFLRFWRATRRRKIFFFCFICCGLDFIKS